MSSGGGWMTTKKKGRDDKAIQAAQQKAMQARRAKRGLAPLKQKKNGTTAKKKSKSSEWVASSDSEESHFSPDEEESEEDIELPESESEEDDNGNDNDDSDDDDGPSSSFLQVPKSKQRKFKIKPMIEQTAKLKKKAKENGYTGKRPAVDDDDSSDDDDDFMNGSSYFAKKSTRQGAKKTTAVAKKESDISFHTDEEIDSPPPPSNTKSKYFATKSNSKNGVAPWSEEDDDATPGRPTKASKMKSAGRKRMRIANDDNDDDDDDDEVLVLSPIAGAPSRQRQSIGSSSWAPDSDDDFVGDDEAVAIAEAMKASLRDAKKAGKKKTKRWKKLGPSNKKNGKIQSHNKRKKKTESDSPSSSQQDDFLQDSEEEDTAVILESEEEEKPIEILDATSSDDDDDEPEGDEQDAYMDEDAREASTVLAAANELSASVLRIMTSWASDINGSDENGNGKVTVPQGMIVDGAIAMTSMKKNPGKAHNNNSSHSWISNEVMQKVLPKVTLAEYQLVGVNWLAMLHSMTCTVTGTKDAKPTNVNGVLADEMGLGKTCQTIAFFAWLKHSRSNGAIDDQDAGLAAQAHDTKDHDMSENEESDMENEPDVIDVDKTPLPKQNHAEVSMRRTDEESSPDTRLPHLIVVPASVVSNWEREFQNFAPDMNVVKYHGSMEERGELKQSLRRYLRKQANAPMVDVILTSISYFQKESSEDRDFLKKLRYDYLVVDEGHLLKNAKGLRYKNLDKFRTRHRLLLTGTPVQNSPQELMALLCFLMPLFSRKTGEFDDQNDSDGGESMLQHFVNLEESGANKHESSHEFAYRKLKQLFAPFVLRRRKKDVLSQIIPPKTYQIEFVTLEEQARSQYNAVIEAHLKAKRSKTNRATDHLFTSLRKAAHHPHLLRTRFTSPTEIDHLSEWFFKYGAFSGEASSKDRVAKELEGFNDFEIHLTAHELLEQNPLRSAQLDRYLLSRDDLFASAKFIRLRAILPKLIGDGHRILIFSVWTSCLDLLGCLLEEMGLNYMRMDGQTPVVDRQERIDKFNEDASIPLFLLSTKACGMGINLTSADTCIMHDIDMNPFSDLQAEDRCHRIGQKKPVKIIKLIAKDTVDSDIYEMQERKVKMNEAIMETPSGWSKHEKKEKSLIIQTVVNRHSKEASAEGSTSAGKENVENNNVENTDGKSTDESVECQI